MTTFHIGVRAKHISLGMTVILGLLLLVSGARSADDAGAAAYGFRQIGSIRGNRALHWLGNSYPGVTASSLSIVGICSDSNCLNNKQIKPDTLSVPLYKVQPMTSL